MKAFIATVFICLAAFGAAVLFWQDHEIRTCRLAGYDGDRAGLCVYRSRYVQQYDYTSPPNRAEGFMVSVRGFEEDVRTHRQ